MTFPRPPSPRNRKKNTILRPVLWCLVGCCIGHWHGRRYSHSNNDTLSSLPLLFHNDDGRAIPALENNKNNTTNDDGWKQMDVFYGKSPSSADDNKRWFSQAAQDELIIGLFKGKRDGYFIDLAANDAMLLSNTYALEQSYGWNGLCIEPNPLYWKNLTLYRSCQIVAAVVGDTRMQAVSFRYEAGDHGGIADAGFDNGKRWQRSSETAYTVTLQEILQRYHAPYDIDYLSLDVEGAETFILQHFPLDQYRIKIITAERLKGDIRGYLKQHGYEFVEKLTRWGESLWVHSSVRDELDWSVLERLQFPRGE